MPERPTRKRRTLAALFGDLDRVRDDGDRRRSFEVLDAFLSAGLDPDRAARVADALVALEDPRCGPVLLEVAHDPRRPPHVRAAAVEILAATPWDDPPHDASVAWSQSHDPFVRALGVQYLDAPDGRLIAAAASDPEPIVRRTAVEAMASLVRTRELVAALRRALRDEDALVREVACRVALFDEPVEASWELLRGLSDDAAVVRAAAYDALEWFPRVSVLLALADARASSPDHEPADTVLGVLAARVHEAVEGASPGARRRLERWAGPVTWLLDASKVRRRAVRGDVARSAGAEARGTAGTPDRAEPRRVDVAAASKLLLDPGTSPIVQRELLARRSWARAGRRGLEVLAACAAGGNWGLRQLTARPLAAVASSGAAAPAATDVLAALASDREPVVRRAAFVAVLERPEIRDGRFIEAARAALREPRARPTAGDHAMALVASHGGADEIARTVLDELSRPDDRDGLFLGAIHLARLANVPRAVPALLALVNAPIVASVLAHVAALQTLRAFGHPRSRIDLRHLDGVDHLDVQRELGEWGWRGERWG